MEAMDGRLFTELMGQFFDQGWMLGSSGGMAACIPADNNNILVSPSSVPKERLAPSDLFLYEANTMQNPSDGALLSSQPLDGPSHLKPSACTPLFLLLLQSTPGSQCVIHTHSKCANLVTAMLGGKRQLELANQEMLKGIMDRTSWKALQNTHKLVVPIVENAPQEQDLLPALREALDQFPHSPAILVRRHGLFVWGPSWQKTKVMVECMEYLLEICWEMGRAGLEF